MNPPTFNSKFIDNPETPSIYSTQSSNKLGEVQNTLPTNNMIDSSQISPTANSYRIPDDPDTINTSLLVHPQSQPQHQPTNSFENSTSSSKTTPFISEFTDDFGTKNLKASENNTTINSVTKNTSHAIKPKSSIIPSAPVLNSQTIPINDLQDVSPHSSFTVPHYQKESANPSQNIIFPPDSNNSIFIDQQIPDTRRPSHTSQMTTSSTNSSSARPDWIHGEPIGSSLFKNNTNDISQEYEQSHLTSISSSSKVNPMVFPQPVSTNSHFKFFFIHFLKYI